MTDKVSPDTKLACVNVFSKHIVPEDDALRMAAAWAACVPVAVNVFANVKLVAFEVCVTVPKARDSPFAVISPDKLVSVAFGVIAVLVSAM